MGSIIDFLKSLTIEEDKEEIDDLMEKNLFEKILSTYELAKLQELDQFNFFKNELIKSTELSVFNDKIKISEERNNNFSGRGNSSLPTRRNPEYKRTQDEFIKKIFDDLKVIKSKTDKKSYVLSTDKTDEYEYKYRKRKKLTLEEKNNKLITYFRSKFFLMAIDTPTDKKDLRVFLKEINPFSDPDDEKIKRVLEEYEKYKEQDSKTVDSSSKLNKELALKQAIDEALKTNMLILPTIDLIESKRAERDLQEKINLALNSQSDNPNIVSDFSLSQPSKSISDEALEKILFLKEVTVQCKVELTKPERKLESIEEFKAFLAENEGTNLDENKVKEAFDAYNIYYDEKLTQYDISVKLKKSQEIQSNGVSDSKFNEIVDFLDILLKAELNALSFTQPSIPSEAEEDFQDEGEPEHQPIPVEGKKHDKVAEFKEFLKTNNLICNSDNLQKVFALHELYQTYEAYLEKTDGKIPDLGAFKNEIRGLIFKMGYVPQSSTQRSEESQFKLSTEESQFKLSTEESQFKLSTEEVEEILTFLNKNQKSEKKDNFQTLNPPLDIRKEEQIIVKTVEDLKELKKNAITGILESWYSMDNKTDDKTLEESKDSDDCKKYARETYEAYETYANASEQDTLVLKAIVLSKLNYGDHQDVSKNLKALGFLKILDDHINERYDASIASYQKRAKQEEPNEIIKFITDISSNITEIPRNILKVFGWDNAGNSPTKEKG